jgi:hypothetical protein
MRSLIVLSATALVFGIGMAAGSAAPASGLAVAAPAPTVTLVDGWWEQENHNDAGDRYWQLSPRNRRSYDAAEARIQRRHHHHLDQYDHHDDRDVKTEHRLLKYQ